MPLRLPSTLFSRTALLLAVAFITVNLTAWLPLRHFIALPLLEQANEDAAALLVLSAQTWAELPPQTRSDFEAELAFSHDIELTQITHTQNSDPNPESHLDELQQALELRLGQPIQIQKSTKTPNKYQTDLPIANRILRLEFPRDSIAHKTPAAIIGLLITSMLTALITTLFLVRYLTRPLKHLSHAVQRYGRGEKHIRLKATGPDELSMLTQHFNTMTEQVDELLTNRTTLLAGISHDLKTPIARLSLALEMLTNVPNQDSELIERMRQDLEEMDQLIKRTLESAKGFEDTEHDRDEINLPELLDGLVAEHKDDTKPIDWRPHNNCYIHANVLALRRIIANLLENALRYGEDSIEIRYQCDDKTVLVEILDRGPGIPSDKLTTIFQPFFRLESSRNTETGGSGLGLAIVQQLARTHGWKVKLKLREGGGLIAQLKISHKA